MEAPRAALIMMRDRQLCVRYIAQRYSERAGAQAASVTQHGICGENGEKSAAQRAPDSVSSRASRVAQKKAEGT